MILDTRRGSPARDPLDHRDDLEREPWNTLVVALALAVTALQGVAIVVLGLPLVLLVPAAAASPLVAILLVALVRRPQRGVLLLAALVPFDGLQKVVGFPAGWKEALTLLVVAATFVAPVSARAASRRNLPQWSYALGALVVLSGISAVVVGGTQALVGMKVGFFYVLIALCVWRCPLGPRERDRLVTILMVTGVVVAVFGLVQQVLGDARLVELGWEYNVEVRTAGGYLRSFSTFATNFAFALYLMLVLLVGSAVALADPGRRRNQLFFLSTPVLLAGMASAITRVAWLGLAVGLVYLAITRFRPLRVVLVDGLAIVVVLLAVASSVGGVFLSSESSEARVDLWGENVGQIAAHPLGAGIGGSGSAAERTAELEDDSSEVFQPDNYYFKMAYELGVVGLWIFALLLVTAGTSMHRAAARLTGSDAALAGGVAASILAAAVASVVATYLEIFPLDFYFWLLLGVVAACAADSG